MIGYIYKTTDTLNNRLYIGKHVGEFDPKYFGSGLHLKRAINKYGKRNFKLEIVVYSDDENKLNELEKKYIAEYRKQFGKSKLYNIYDGGEGAPLVDNNSSKRPEVREKISKTLIGKKHTAERIEKNSIGHTGKSWGKHSSETIEKMRINNLGDKNPFWGKHLHQYCIICNKYIGYVPIGRHRKTCSDECISEFRSRLASSIIRP